MRIWMYLGRVGDKSGDESITRTSPRGRVREDESSRTRPHGGRACSCAGHGPAPMVYPWVRTLLAGCTRRGTRGGYPSSVLLYLGLGTRRVPGHVLGLASGSASDIIVKLASASASALPILKASLLTRAGGQTGTYSSIVAGGQTWQGRGHTWPRPGQGQGRGQVEAWPRQGQDQVEAWPRQGQGQVEAWPRHGRGQVRGQVWSSGLGPSVLGLGPSVLGLRPN